MANVKIIIDDVEYEVPGGENLVQAAKENNIDIPVFCYHPKMDPVGMCRMCLVEQWDARGERWLPKPATACTMTTYDGLKIRTLSDSVVEARKNILEFLLTSHPLDCPVCDKGGECSLQNLTMEYGPGVSRINFEDKINLDKHVPLGDLIYLDEERCIQCARCIRFQSEVVGDPVLGFHERGRTLQIVTVSDPPFDTYFSGNTTDICPVGALTTEDFRFGARPWELTNVPSICTQCPVGCNTTLSTRLDRESGGKTVIKRVMPRQNEEVNEIWICDKGRFGHHFTRDNDRMTQPLVRRGTGDSAVSHWTEALTIASQALLGAEGNIAAIAGGSMSNEDLYMLNQVVTAAGGSRLGAWTTHAGADLVAQVGVGVGTNFKDLGAGEDGADVVLIIASDLEEEAANWRLRVKQAHDRGAYVIVANARETAMDKFASASFRYVYGDAASTFANKDIRQKLQAARNLIIIAGAEGLTLDGSRALMQTAANFLIETGHVGKPNNGLLSTLPGSNGMGLHYFGFSPEATREISQNPPKVLIVAQADILADDPSAAAWINKVDTVITLSLFADELSQQAAAALPIQSFAERDGSFTNGERRVQRFYTAQNPMGEAIPAWVALSRILEHINGARPKSSAAAVMLEITKSVPAFAGCRYSELSKVVPQTPDVGGEDLYYGGTSYKNTGGMGVQIPSAVENGNALTAGTVTDASASAITVKKDELLVVPVTRLYNRQRTFLASEAALMSSHIDAPHVVINEVDAKKLSINEGDQVEVSVGSVSLRVSARVDNNAPEGVVLLPRNLSVTASVLTVGAGKINKVRETAVASA